MSTEGGEINAGSIPGNIISKTIGPLFQFPEVFCARCAEQLAGQNVLGGSWAVAHDGREVCFRCIADVALESDMSGVVKRRLA